MLFAVPAHVRRTSFAVALLCAAMMLRLDCYSSSARADDDTPASNVGVNHGMPLVPIGLDAYRMWDRWPYQRIGARAYMRSTYDRAGGNVTADASHFLYQQREDFNVTLDVEAPGVLYFVRTNHWHGSPWHYEVDGSDHVVQETTTADATRKLEHSVFMPEELFPNPLAWTYADTKGADLMWVPIPFEQRLRLAYSRTFYGTGYYIYHLYDPGANLSQPLRTWDASPPDPAVLKLLAAAGTDIAPHPHTADGKRLGVVEKSGVLSLAPQQSVTFFDYQGTPVMFRALKLSVPQEHALEFGRARLRITWDGRDQPSIDAPISLFFGTGTLHNRDEKEYLVKALPVNVRYSNQRVELACYFPMPAFRSARFELVSEDAESAADIPDVRWLVRYHPFNDPPNHVGYFHATYCDHGEPTLGEDLVFLDTSTEESSTQWSGSFVGTSFTFSDRANLTTLEGDPRFFFDDSQTPQCYGTGTEEWGGGGDYWGGRNMTIPLAGHPVGVARPQDARSEEELIQSAYRFLLADLMPFGKRAVIRFEHGGHNESTERYRSVTYWYGLPSPSLVLTDELEIGNRESERSHAYSSPQASEPYEITSRYEWGVDHTVEGKEVFPAQSMLARKTTGSSQFEIELRPDNHGVVLRRTLDYKYPNQRAEVFVADAGAADRKWQRAGAWYLAGSTTWYHSFPTPEQGGELGPAKPIVKTSNRRYRDDEFIISSQLTRKRTRIAVRLDFTPVAIPLLPVRQIDELAWTEIRYRIYCWVPPEEPLLKSVVEARHP